LVARGAPPDEVLDALLDELTAVMGASAGTAVTRFEGDYEFTIIAVGGVTPSELLGRTIPLDGDGVLRRVWASGRFAVMEGYEGTPGEVAAIARQIGIRSSAGVPIHVDGRLWGAIALSWTDDEAPFGEEETRLLEFTEFAATAISLAESRERLSRLLDEQAALRRVATLVASGAPRDELLAATADEARRLVRADLSAINQYLADETVTALHWSGEGDLPSTGDVWELGGTNVSTLIAQTGQRARLDDFSEASGPIGIRAQEAGIGATVGVPVLVEGRLWGFMSVSMRGSKPLSADTEERLSSFTELLATAIANAESRAELTASRARVMAASDEARRRIERDLHDGVQQRIVSLGVELRAAQTETASPRLSQAISSLNAIYDELREIALGLHPAALAEGGLAGALGSLARRSPIPVELDIALGAHLPEQIEVATYYMISEALTNAAKHARATRVRVTVTSGEERVQFSVIDDGSGGADPVKGSGLLGLRDRAATMGGSIAIESPAGGGTTIRGELPTTDAG
jgi:signal transduction histidine kinase